MKTLTLTPEQELAISNFFEAFPHLAKFPYKHVEEQIRKNYQELAYPDNDRWHSSYCIPLASNVTIGKDQWDLGIFFGHFERRDHLATNPQKLSICNVWGNEGGEYSSGPFWASNNPGKKLSMILHRYEIFTKEDLMCLFAEHNSLYLRFFESDKSDIWKIGKNW